MKNLVLPLNLRKRAKEAEFYYRDSELRCLHAYRQRHKTYNSRRRETRAGLSSVSSAPSMCLQPGKGEGRLRR